MSKSNKVKYNIKNVHVAKMTENADGTYTYETPWAIPGAVSISLDPEGETSPFYADGIVYFRTFANNGYSGDLEMAYLPDRFRSDILKETRDKNGVLVERSDNDDTAKFALLFEFDGDAKSVRHVLYNCTASRPSIASQTKEDTIESVTETLSLTADARSDGLVKARTGDNTGNAAYTTWYDAVYEPFGVDECVSLLGDKEATALGETKVGDLIADAVIQAVANKIAIALQKDEQKRRKLDYSQISRHIFE